MGILARLLGRHRVSDATAAWRRDASRRVVVDLHEPSLCGVRLGEPFERLAFLGPARWSDASFPMYEFLEVGLVLEEERGALAYIVVVIEPDGLHDVRPFSGALAFRGDAFDVSVVRSEADWVRVFGPPARRDADEEEVVLFYDWNGARFDVEFTLQDRLKTIRIAAAE